MDWAAGDLLEPEEEEEGVTVESLVPPTLA